MELRICRESGAQRLKKILMHNQVTGDECKTAGERATKRRFPSIWLHWHFMHRPKSAEREALLSPQVVPEDA